MLDVVEELVGKAEGIFNPHRVADALHEAAAPAFGAAAQRPEIGLGAVHIFRGSHAEGEGRHGGHRPFTQDQIVVDKLLHRTQIEGLFFFSSHRQAENIDVKFSGGSQIGDLKFHIGAAHHVGGRNCAGG